MSLLVTNVLIAGSFLVESESMSVVVSKRRPKIPTDHWCLDHWCCLAL